MHTPPLLPPDNWNSSILKRHFLAWRLQLHAESRRNGDTSSVVGKHHARNMLWVSSISQKQKWLKLKKKKMDRFFYGSLGVSYMRFMEWKKKIKKKTKKQTCFRNAVFTLWVKILMHNKLLSDKDLKKAFDTVRPSIGKEYYKHRFHCHHHKAQW